MNIWKKRSVIKLDILGEKDEYLSIIKRRSNGLYKLVEVFYDLSKLEANEYKFNMEKIDINKEVREHILLFYNDFENKNINVEINLLNEEVFVEADKTALERVFTNLFQNTIKYSRGEFKISLEKTKHNVKIILINSIDELTEREVEKILAYLKELCVTSRTFKRNLESVTSAYKIRLEKLKNILIYNRKTDWNQFSVEEKLMTKNLVMLVGLLYRMCRIKLVLKSENDLNTVNKTEVDKNSREVEKALEEVKMDNAA